MKPCAEPSSISSRCGASETSSSINAPCCAVSFTERWPSLARTGARTRAVDLRERLDAVAAGLEGSRVRTEPPRRGAAGGERGPGN